MANETPEWVPAISLALRVRDSANPTDRSTRSALRKALSEHTELSAIPYVAPHWNGANRTALLRAVALAAEFNNVPHTSDPVSLGRFARHLSVARSRSEAVDPQRPDAVASRLLAMPDLDLTGAVDVCRSILSLGRDAHVSVNYFSITRLLVGWGKGFSKASQRVRRTPIVDYYSPIRNKNTDNEQES